MNKQSDIISALMSGAKGTAETGLKTMGLASTILASLGSKAIYAGIPLALATPFAVGYGAGKLKRHLDEPLKADISAYKRDNLLHNYNKAISGIEKRIAQKSINKKDEEANKVDDVSSGPIELN